MLRITVPLTPEGWDEKKEEFVPPKTVTIQLEHSLVSISKWESKWRKPFIHTKDKTDEETLDYVKCMTLTQNVDPEVYDHLTDENIKEIADYIYAPMTATRVRKDPGSKGRPRIVTSELIYCWMIELGIPFECQKWHLNRLITLIDVCNAENKPRKKMSEREIMERNSALNEERKKMLNTKG